MNARYLTTIASVAACLLAATARLQADDKDAKDKLDKGKNTIDNIKQADPPKVSTTTRTQEQAIKEYKDSGKPTGPQTVKTNEPPPPPVNKLNPTGDKDGKGGIDKQKQENKESQDKAQDSKKKNN
jgi:hypothetical protein